jgi:hypothetical protein
MPAATIIGTVVVAAALTKPVWRAVVRLVDPAVMMEETEGSLLVEEKEVVLSVHLHHHHHHDEEVRVPYRNYLDWLVGLEGLEIEKGTDLVGFLEAGETVLRAHTTEVDHQTGGQEGEDQQTDVGLGLGHVRDLLLGEVSEGAREVVVVVLVYLQHPVGDLTRDLDLDHHQLLRVEVDPQEKDIAHLQGQGQDQDHYLADAGRRL